MTKTDKEKYKQKVNHSMESAYPYQETQLDRIEAKLDELLQR